MVEVEPGMPMASADVESLSALIEDCSIIVVAAENLLLFSSSVSSRLSIDMERDRPSLTSLFSSTKQPELCKYIISGERVLVQTYFGLFVVLFQYPASRRDQAPDNAMLTMSKTNIT